MRLDFDLAYTRARFTDFDSAGHFIPGAPAWVVAGGVTFGGESGWFGAFRGRYFGPRPLIEDDSVRSQASLIFNARAGYKFDNGLRLQLDVFSSTRRPTRSNTTICRGCPANRLAAWRTGMCIRQSRWRCG
jgi:outer membrane receptor protein involved in Fe transport